MLAEHIYQEIENKEAIYSFLVNKIFSQSKKEHTFN
jgi:hypothetical protein